ncbi:MAG: hypothetical protein R2876_04080 [Eubacteriales bacterium]
MHETNIVNLGIGFATGRKSFQRVLKTYIYNWKESGLTTDQKVKLNLLIAYDVKYSNTKRTDYTNINNDLLSMIDEVFFIGREKIRQEIDFLVGNNVVDLNEAKRFFCGGYSGQRNSVIYFAIKNKIDYLVFLDDDEYPIAVTKTRHTALWSGQHVLNTHLHYIKNADITHGYHCGYISPIPYIRFDDVLTEADFRMFIEAISNDIVNWDTIKTVMNNGGATYADTSVLIKDTAEEVEEVNRAKFISGANLCINLTEPERVNAFYNPPGARGEDTFLSTTLSNRKVLKVPCYTFHDGFSTYNHLLDGVLPIKLKSATADSKAIVLRFYRACIGWIRYKPLFLYITKRENYLNEIEKIRSKLEITIPKVCEFFENENFKNIYKELERYHRNVEKHYADFQDAQNIWGKIKDFID